nr:PREDICTED: 5'-3' exoribonuclease 1 [Bemisia tabaci]
MGVPKFFRYMSERYPCLSELIKEYEIPAFDNMYLDMNGIIHVCSHPNDNNPHFRITEDKIFQDIFKYIEVLFRLIQPRKLFFMAVDGVAPRAKMNHQRGRRFRSAKDAENSEKLAKSKGEVLPEEKRFDSNCITPGTNFMVKLQKQLQIFVNRKISEDKMWRKIKIILSGHECPGEGEHKIMDYIRYMKSQKNYDPNTRHCIYGLDADLIMLGLCTHEPYFSLLREEVKFGKQNNMRVVSAEEIKFYLLHLSVMRDYLDLEFQDLKKRLSFPYDLECIINDWVLMGFLVGNDFIPHLPNFHIANGALPLLYNAYIEVLPTLDGYLNEEGKLNLRRFERFLKKLSEFDEDNFREKTADLKFLEGKRLRSLQAFNPDELDDGAPDELELPDDPELSALIKETNDLDSEDMDEDAIFGAEFYADKKDYYKSKMGIDMNEETIRHQAAVYIEAIQWNLHYYYDGCRSWSWFYPYHYAPYVSDITNFADLQLDFNLSKPFLPFEQLLAVLPPASKELLPVPYQRLMTDERSPIIEYYPDDFDTDLNGKKQDWEAVVLLPFIEEERLKSAMASCADELTRDEVARNSHGPMYIYSYSKSDSSVPENYNGPLKPGVHVDVVYREDLFVKPRKLVKGLCKGVNLGAYMFGFPNLRHINFKATLEKSKVMVFEQPSRYESMILNIQPQEEIKLSELASQILNKIVYVDWPFLCPAKVSQVLSEEEKYILESDGKIVSQKMTKSDLEAMQLCVSTVETRYKNKKGINVGETSILLMAHKLIGQKRVFMKNTMVSFEREFAVHGSYFVHQAVVTDIGSSEYMLTHLKPLDEVFKPDSDCFMLGHPHYGSIGKVVEVSKTGRVRIEVRVMGEPNFEIPLRNSVNVLNAYMKPHQAASRLGISPHLLSRITGTIFATKPSSEEDDGSLRKEIKVNIGLNLKFTKKLEVVPGYVRRTEQGWVYSTKTVDLIISYMRKYPTIFEHINKCNENDVYKATDLFPHSPDPNLELDALSKWLKSEPFYSIPRVSCATELLEEVIVQDVYVAVNQFYESQRRKKSVTLEVKPFLLYQPVEKLDVKLPDPSTVFYLFDRVICVRESFSVPLGLKGTVVGIQRDKQDTEDKDLLIIVLFDKDFTNSDSLDPLCKRMHRLHPQGLINISHGERLANKSSAPKSHINAVADKTAGSWRQNNNPQSAFASVDSKEEFWNANSGSRSSGEKSNSGYFRNDFRKNNFMQSSPQHSVDKFFNKSDKYSHTPLQKHVNENSSASKSKTNSNSGDYSAMWEELQKAKNSKPKSPPPVVDPSNALKKMLQIVEAPKALSSLRPETRSLTSSGQTPNAAFATLPTNVNAPPPLLSNTQPNFMSSPDNSFPRNLNPFNLPYPGHVFGSNGTASGVLQMPPRFPSSLPPPPIVAPTHGKCAPPVVPNFPMNSVQENKNNDLSPFCNPFVPLQVTRNQVTHSPRGSASAQTSESFSGQKLQSSNGSIPPLVSNSSTNITPATAKPRKSRIAAKFMAPPDPKA